MPESIFAGMAVYAPRGRHTAENPGASSCRAEDFAELMAR